LERVFFWKGYSLDAFKKKLLKRRFEDLIENLFGIELVKLCSSQDLIICNGVMKWPNSNHMTCIHGLGSSVVDYVISDIPVSNQITTFDLLNDHEPDSDHKPLTLTLKFSMHRSTIEETNPWYDKECKIARKSIRDASNEPLKLDKINTYKALIKRKKRYYINKRQEQLSQLYKLDPKKFWSQILKCNTKENNRIPLRD
jgi:hypothetical protein